MLRNYVTDKFRIISDTDAETYRELCDIDAGFKLSRFSGKSLALHCHPENLIKLAIELDGIASSILLVPFDACKEFSMLVEEKLNLDFVISDGMTNTEHWETEVCCFDVVEIRKETFNSQSVKETQWLLTTSGTTGSPKIVAHTLDSLTRTIAKKTDATRFTWGLLYDPARFAGLQVVLQAMISNSSLIVPSPNLDFESKIAYLVTNRCNALSATPSLWRKILMTRAAKELNLKQATLGGEIADQRILNSLTKHFPTSVITHIFASTEAGVGFSVKDKKAGFPSSWLESGVRGVEMKVSEQGTLCLKNTHVNQCYKGDGGKIADVDGWIDTGDLVELIGDRVLFKGRLNGAINIGGNKVTPEDIEACVLDVPGVYQVAVRAKPSSIAGALIEALIIPSPELEHTADLVKLVKQHCKQNLSSYKVPAFVRIVAELPVSAAGKVKR